MSDVVSGLKQSWVERTLRDAGAAFCMVPLVLDRHLLPVGAVRGPAPELEVVTLGSHDDAIGVPGRVHRPTMEALNLLRDASGLIDATTKRLNAQPRTGRAP